jgi:antitoxin component YwqK of YwqJK toxin-antitoxin module
MRNFVPIIFLGLLLLTQSCFLGQKKRMRPYAELPDYNVSVTDQLNSPLMAIDSLDSAGLVNQYLLPDEFEAAFMAEDPASQKKKKVKASKKEFMGIRFKKGFTKTGAKEDENIETFGFLQELPPPPNPYLRDYYWLDIERNEISRNRDVADKRGYVLHGPYERSIGGDIIEKGQFYKGLKHGRWIIYNRNFILQDKITYYMGWPLESEFAYYANDSKVKSILPIEYGEKEGNFYLFHENGQLAVSGQYRFDQKVGVWTEYYRQQRRTKRQIQYSPDPFDKKFKPYIIREYDERGNLIYERSNSE